jgi:hypothetical protein
MLRIQMLCSGVFFLFRFGYIRFRDPNLDPNLIINPDTIPLTQLDPEACKTVIEISNILKNTILLKGQCHEMDIFLKV